MVQPVTVGLDIAKNVFHAYGVDAHGEKVFSRKLRRAQVEAFFAKLDPCLIGIELFNPGESWHQRKRFRVNPGGPMGQILHGSAKTTHAVRAAIQ